MTYRWFIALLGVAACGTVKATASDAGVDAVCAGSGCADAQPDAPDPVSYPPAAVWIAPGGEPSTANAQLDLSVGAAYGAGPVSASSGATFSNGFLTTDTE